MLNETTEDNMLEDFKEFEKFVGQHSQSMTSHFLKILFSSSNDQSIPEKSIYSIISTNPEHSNNIENDSNIKEQLYSENQPLSDDTQKPINKTLPKSKKNKANQSDSEQNILFRFIDKYSIGILVFIFTIIIGIYIFN